MIVDVHTHIEKDDDQSRRDLEEFKKIRGLGPDFDQTWAYGMNWDNHWQAMAPVDKAVVFCARPYPDSPTQRNDYLAEYVSLHPDKLIGFGAVNPWENDPVAEVRRCVEQLGLCGLKLLPIYAELPPNHRKWNPIYQIAQELRLPVLLHMGTHFLPNLPLKCTQPLDLDEVAINFPELTIIAAHLAHPWVADAVVVIRKHPNLYADISGLSDFRPYGSLYQGLVYAMEYDVLGKLLFGTDLPLTAPAEEMQRLREINRYAEGTNLPRIPAEAIDDIIEKNAQRALQLDV